ncbi:amino acid ABC transporter permease [Alphaproteobacteria bacterium]|nr:amino acid ABC transporter permease [Alphaproteobacteria bacterium]MDC0394615.1 amino acid ABC transporter permease [Alphaproteobacteria bacterium]MDC0462307.1 amino acid ABC transporter permease [Alphaproteobacteria bacterium]
MSENSTNFIKIPDREPPINSIGWLAWIRHNLFGSTTNTLITVLFFYLFYLYIPPFIDWAILNANISGSDRSVCDANKAGACWTFIKVRLDQLLFGLYFATNPEEIWRPIFVFALFGMLVVPLVIDSTPHKKWLLMILLTIYPVIFIAVVYGGVFGIPVSDTGQWGGLLLTFALAFVGIVLALPLGILLALGRRSEMPIVRALSITYIEFWRGTPLITILFMASVMLPLFFPSGVEFDKVVRAMIGITLFQSAYTAEAVRGGLQAIDKGQNEASMALGMGYWRRTMLIILPQALKISIPSIVNTFIALFKDTSLVSIIGLLDLLKMSQNASRSLDWNGYDIEGYLFAGFIFWIFCFGMSSYSQKLEQKLDTDRRSE